MLPSRAMVMSTPELQWRTMSGLWFYLLQPRSVLMSLSCGLWKICPQWSSTRELVSPFVGCLIRKASHAPSPKRTGPSGLNGLGELALNMQSCFFLPYLHQEQRRAWVQWHGHWRSVPDPPLRRAVLMQALTELSSATTQALPNIYHVCDLLECMKGSVLPISMTQEQDNQGKFW